MLLGWRFSVAATEATTAAVQNNTSIQQQQQQQHHQQLRTAAATKAFCFEPFKVGIYKKVFLCFSRELQISTKNSSGLSLRSPNHSHELFTLSNKSSKKNKFQQIFFLTLGSDFHLHWLKKKQSGSNSAKKS